MLGIELQQTRVDRSEILIHEPLGKMSVHFSDRQGKLSVLANAEIYHQIDRDNLALIYLEFAIGIARENSLAIPIDCEKLALTMRSRCR